MKVVISDEFTKSLKRLIWHERLAFINPAEWYRQVKWFIQRGRRGYSDRDLWNANDHIARTVLAFLEHSETCKMQGYPMGLTAKRWEEYKGEIRWLMSECVNDDTPIEVMLADAYQKRRARAQRIFGKHWENLWD